MKTLTRKEKTKRVNDAIALAGLDAQPPTEFCKNLLNKYIKGEMELDAVKSAILNSYNRHQLV